MGDKKRRKRVTAVVRGSALAGAWAVCAPVQALQFEFDEFLLNVDTTLGAAAQWRTESSDKDLAAAENSNDGNNNFDTGLVSGRGNIILEVGGEYRDFSFFVRTDAMYDYVYEDNDTDMDDRDYLTYNNGFPAGGNVKKGEFPDATIDKHGSRARLLDAFVGYNFSLGEQSGAVRLGRQVISWGEATFYQGVNALQNPIDAVAAVAPGAEAREVFLPTAAIDLKWDFTDNINAEIYYKLQWDNSTLPGVGSFFSTSDFVGPGAERVLLGAQGLGTAERVPTDKPGDDGQWGAAARYVTDDGSNFELYYTRSHSNVPGVDVIVEELDFADLSNSISSLRDVYTEDIDVWAASFSSTFMEAQVYLDVAYSDNMPFIDFTPILPDNGVVQPSSVIRDDYWQVTAGFTDVYTAFPWLSEQIGVLGEMNYQGNNLGESKLIPPPSAFNPDGPGCNVLVTDTAWGYQFRVLLQYYSVIPGMDLTVPITFKHDVDGYGNAIALNNALKEDQKNASFGVDALYLTNWQFSAKYSWFFGNDDPKDLVISDRDNFALSMKYVF